MSAGEGMHRHAAGHCASVRGRVHRRIRRIGCWCALGGYREKGCADVGEHDSLGPEEVEERLSITSKQLRRFVVAV